MHQLHGLQFECFTKDFVKKDIDIQDGVVGLRLRVFE